MAITPAEKKKLKKKYAEEREKRLRADGNDQYIRIGGKFSHYREDPYLPIKERTPKTDHVKFAFIGGGYAGLVTGARLVDQGINDVRIIEKGGDFG
ncbi:MAG: monooxygenase, partial [Proteobacteria bacterium]|nr:monooxygenase [Pseudomonadota bacterium]